MSLVATTLAFCVVVLGAYVRLSNAGLGCPDWPGCYGHYTPPAPEQALAHSPHLILEPHKAWKEMTHRYLAASLGLLILSLALVSSFQKQTDKRFPRWMPWLLVLIVIFQAMLGRWTVTLKLHPFVVMSHLVGGFSTFCLLGWMTFRGKNLSQPIPNLRGKVQLGFFVLLIQILLGGWMSANYASLACPDFPTCQSHWLPPLHFKEAFNLWRDFGQNYEGGVLGNEARATIHYLHRLMAGVVFIYLGSLSIQILRKRLPSPVSRLGWTLLLLLLVQVALGISNVLFQLPIQVAVAHNGGAALLMLTLAGLWKSAEIEDSGSSLHLLKGALTGNSHV